MLQFLEILVLGVMRLAQAAPWFSVYFGFTDQVNKDSESGDINANYFMFKHV